MFFVFSQKKKKKKKFVKSNELPQIQPKSHLDPNPDIRIFS